LRLSERYHKPDYKIASPVARNNKKGPDLEDPVSLDGRRMLSEMQAQGSYN
jgi:hypothetical protein